MNAPRDDCGSFRRRESHSLRSDAVLASQLPACLAVCLHYGRQSYRSLRGPRKAMAGFGVGLKFAGSLASTAARGIRTSRREIVGYYSFIS